MGWLSNFHRIVRTILVKLSLLTIYRLGIYPSVSLYWDDETIDLNNNETPKRKRNLSNAAALLKVRSLESLEQIRISLSFIPFLSTY